MARYGQTTRRPAQRPRASSSTVIHSTSTSSGYEPVDTAPNTAGLRWLTMFNMLMERYTCQRVVVYVRLCQAVGHQSGTSVQGDGDPTSLSSRPL